uniref:Uncharacterized protein n=1 Tax=Plectus sambesii TaxID=2011161 RepID=A0A914X3B8_9BILA
MAKFPTVLMCALLLASFGLKPAQGGPMLYGACVAGCYGLLWSGHVTAGPAVTEAAATTTAYVVSIVGTALKSGGDLKTKMPSERSNKTVGERLEDAAAGAFYGAWTGGWTGAVGGWPGIAAGIVIGGAMGAAGGACAGPEKVLEACADVASDEVDLHAPF